MPKLSRRNKGFSLIELLMTLLISSLLMLFAWPSLFWYQHHQLEQAIEAFTHAHQEARLFAITHQTSVYIIPKSILDWSDITWQTADNTTVAHFQASHLKVHFKGFIYAPYLVIDCHGQSDNAGRWTFEKNNLTQVMVLNRGGRLKPA